MGLFSAIWIRIRGFFLKTSDELVSGSPDAIRATYRTVEEREIQQYNEMLDAVASLMRQREDTLQELERVQNQVDVYEEEMEGALAFAESESENMEEHRAAYERAFGQKDRFQQRAEELDARAEQLTERVEGYKLQLQEFQGRIESIRQEGDESVADLVSSQAIIRIEQRIQGLSTESTDQALSAVRRRVADTKAKAQITSELAGTDVARQRQRYRAAGRQSAGSSAFDEMLEQRQQGKTAVEGETEEAEAERRRLGQ